MPTITYDNFLEYLLETLPEMRAPYQEMLDDDGEIFFYILVGDALVKLAVRNFEMYSSSVQLDQNVKNLLDRLINFLENCASFGDEDVVELILVGFMEHLDANHPNFSDIATALKPASRQLLRLSRGI